MLIVPVVLPPVIAAYSVVGERDQGTLEPVLTAPVRASELLLGKAVATFLPSVGLAYAIYLVILISIRLGAAASSATSPSTRPNCSPSSSSSRSSRSGRSGSVSASPPAPRDVRVAQQLATLASLPLLAFTSLISFQIITPSVPLAIGLALALLAIDVAGWRIVARLFDRERLITGHPNKSTPSSKEARTRLPAGPAAALASLLLLARRAAIPTSSGSSSSLDVRRRNA